MFKQAEKVNWINAQTLDNGYVCAVSEKSGIMKITFPGSYHTLMLFQDQFHALGITDAELVAYVNRNSHVIRRSGENKAAKKLDKAKQALLLAIANNPALSDEQKQSLIKTIAA